MAAPLVRSGSERSPGGVADGDGPPFAGLNVPGFAWEFLRRNPDYRADYSRSKPLVDPRWGLRFPADPLLPASKAEVFWREDVAPGIVLPVISGAESSGRHLATRVLEGLVRRGEDGLHLRLAAGLQLLIRGEATLAGPVLVVLGFDGDFGLRVRAVEALERVANGRAAPRSRLTPAQRLRLVRSLAALDGSQRHESYRQIARSIFGDEVVERDPWRTASIRDATVRLVRTGRALMKGGYLNLLRGGL